MHTALRLRSLTRFALVAGLLLSLALLPPLVARPLGAADPAVEAPVAADVVQSVRSGRWSDGATWSTGRPPAAGDKVLIRSSHLVEYDVASDAPIRAVVISGELQFSRRLSTRLVVGLIRIEAGDRYSEEGFECDAAADSDPSSHGPGRRRPALVVGSADQPIPGEFQAVIRLAHAEGLDKQSCPAVVCCGGRMEFHGAALPRTWVKLAARAAAGDSTVQAAEPLVGWKPGDRIVVTASNASENYRGEPRSETRLVRAIADRVLTLDRPLDYDHEWSDEFRPELANLSRNVIVESADPDGVRGHTMYHHGSAGSIHYAEFRHLGKRDTLGRYSLHFHLAGSSMRGSSVVGASIWDSHNRWLTVHGTNYLIVRDTVGYGSVGHGFFLEDGTEVFNVFDRNLAIGARPGKKLPKQVLPFDQNEGAGFWWTNSLNTFTRNVAAENGQYGFRYEATPTSALALDFPVLQPDGSTAVVDVRTLPFVRFDDNEAHSSLGLYGVNLGEGVRRVGPDARHPFVVRRLKIWDVHYAFRPQVPSLLVEGLTIDRAAYGVYHPNFDRHVYRDVVIRRTSAEPFNRGHDDDSVQYGSVTVDGLTFQDVRSDGMPLVQITDHNPTGSAETHIRGLQLVNFTGGREKAIVNRGGGPRPAPKTPVGVPVYLHDYFGLGRHAKISSLKALDLGADGLTYREERPLTGNESRVAETKSVAFPRLLDPVDDRPPTTVVTRVVRTSGRTVVYGCTADDGRVRRVVVNDVEARSTDSDFRTWEVELSGEPPQLIARSEDEAGNVERLPHVVR